MQKFTFRNIDFSDFSNFIFRVNHVFMEERDNPIKKVIDKEELDGFARDSILRSENLPRAVLID